MKLEEMVRKALIEYGACLESWKTKIVGIDGKASSDYRVIRTEITKARCRKPFMIWNIKVNIATGMIYWNESSFDRV